MKRNILNIALCAALLSMGVAASAREDVRGGGKAAGTVPSKSFKTEAGDCTTPTAQFDIDINNVRARLLTGGDMWWNLSDAKYAVPKGDGTTGTSLNAIFAGSIWISGVDAGGNLKVAAQRYRQGGDDFWPGVITNGLVDKATCNKYDRFFNVYGADIEKAQTAFATKGTSTTLADIPESVQAWPGKGNPYISTDPNLLGETFIVNDNLAPFKDVDNDGIYDPVKGDYPYIPCRNGEAEAYGDQMVFWVFNDVGNLHTETSGQAIGVQVNALAFAFQTNDDINNMTFYKYEITNKSSNPLRQTYISQWTDADLGCFENDRVGCDVTRSLGITYNGSVDADCNGVSGYHDQLPIVGVDFFEGPLSDSGQQLGLSSFVYFTNSGAGPKSDPSSAAQYRNYMTCKWADGTPFTYGGEGYNSGGPPTCFIFPGNPSDLSQWTECQGGGAGLLQPGDRRMVQTSGPFTLTPGVSQYVTIGVVFVRPPLGPNQVTIPPNFNTTIGPADDKAQALFNTCFKLVDGPSAPNLKIRELSNELIINLENPRGSNNYGESYDEVDGPTAQIVESEMGGNGDSTYTFEGYVLYQLADAKVSSTDLPDPEHADPSKAIIVARVDVKNGVNSIINYEKSAALGGLYVPVLKVNSDGDKGITTSFDITDDKFATGSNKELINNKTYYYAAVAYAYNNYRSYDPDHPLDGGQQTPFLQGRKNFAVYSAIPHGIDSRNNGTALNAKFGDGVDVLRIEGQGNGGNVLNLTPETVAKILASGRKAFADTLEYIKSNDPIGFKVTDPINLKEADFELKFIEDPSVKVGPTTRWQLRDVTNGVTIDGDRPLDRPYEQQVVDASGNQYGFSIKLGTPAPVHVIDGRYLVSPAGPNRDVYDVLPSTITYENPTQKWLSFIKDEGTTQVSNWIRSGTQYYDAAAANAGTLVKAASEVFDDNWYYYSSTTAAPEAFHDSTQIFDKILDGTWAPYCLTSNYNKNPLSSTDIQNGKPPYNYGPGFKWRQYGTQTPPQNTLDRLQSVDIVITDNMALWSKCIVFETGEDQGINQGADLSPNGLAPRKGQLRMAHSKRWHNGNPSSPDYLEDDPTDIGRSYFPGYAINVETGERLNIAFGESSDQGDQNGRDMLWDPTDQVYSPISFPGQIIDRLPYFGGKHFIYVMDSKYDEGDSAQQLLLNNYTLAGPLYNINTALQPLYRSLMWTCIPYLTPGYSFVADQNGNKYIPPADITVKLRVETPYKRLATNATNGDSLPRYQFSTKGLGATQDSSEIAKSALDNIRIVPNPYLAYSAYETDQNSSLVKIINLPNKCNITIYSLDGTIIRKLTRSIEAVDPATNQRIDISDGARISDVNLDNSTTWDLKNDKSIPISSGIYLFHIEAPGIGEKTLKWFGAIRPADTSNF